MNSQTLVMAQIDLDALADLLADKLAARMSAPPTARNDQEPGWLTRKQTAARLSISLPTLNQLTRSGQIPAHRIGRRVLYRPAEIDNSTKKIRA